MNLTASDRPSMTPPCRFLFPEPIMASAAVVLLLMMIPTAWAITVDDRMLQGQNIWMKTLRFELALAIYLLTLSAYARWLPSRVLAHPWSRLVAWFIVLAGMLDLLAIGVPAAAGVPAHFAEADPFLDMVYTVARFFALLITGVAAAYGVLIVDSDQAPRGAGLRMGLVLGLVLSFALTLVVTGYITQTGSHLVMGTSDQGGLFFFGWSRVGGDLRVAHFFGFHAMHAIPLAGWAADRFLPSARAIVAALAATCAYVIFSLWVFVQALMGLPFLPSLG